MSMQSAPQLGGQLLSSTAVCPAGGRQAAVAERAEEEAAAGGRKRRAGDGSTPSPKASPKLAATSREGQQYTTQPDDEAAAVSRGSGCSSLPACEVGHPLPVTAQGVRTRQLEHASSSDTHTEEDSVPLVSSKLAARLAPNRGTPLPGGSGSGKELSSGNEAAGSDLRPLPHPACHALVIY